jgi:hypothetical protein
LGWSLAGLAALAVVVAAAWGWAPSSPAPARLPPDPPQITVTLAEDGIHTSQPVPAGRVMVKVANHGQQPHGLTMVPLGDDEPPIGDLLTNDRAEVRAPFAGLPALDPGDTARIAVDLTANQRYALYDPTPNPTDPQQRSHAQTGWHTEIQPTSQPPTPTSQSSS